MPTKEIKVPIPMKKYEPPHVGGDREFAGHGPDVIVSANLTAINAGRQLALEIRMDAKETQGDWTHFDGTSNSIVFDVADKYPNHRIVDIVSDAFSSLYVRDHDHDANKYPPANGTLVKEFTIHGDTSGDDQPWVAADFNEVTVQLTEIA